MKKSSKENMKRGAEIGGAITAAVLAAAAGAYLMSDKKTRTKANAWVHKARKEVGARTKVAKQLGRKQYDAIVDQVMKRYGSLEDISARDVIAASRELKAQWGMIQKNAQKLAKTPVKRKKTHRKKRITPAARRRRTSHRKK